MTKGQILILLLIIALVFYYLTTDKPNKPEPGEANWKLVKKSTKPQLPKPTFPKSQIEVPTEPITKWPSDFPVLECPAARIEPFNFGLNPPHSQVDEPFELPKPPQEPEPVKKTLNCPAPKVIPDPENVQASEPSSLLTKEEKASRQAQELSDYHWLLNNKTIADWHHEHQLTDVQFQVLSGLVANEEMNTLSYFLTLLPVNYEWTLIDPQFKAQPTLIEQWKPHFTYHQTNDWLKIGLQPTDYALAAWLQNTKHLTPEEALNLADFTQLKTEFNHYGN